MSPLDAQPRRLSPQETLLNALADVQQVVEAHHELTEKLHKIIEPQQAPGVVHAIKLNAANPYSDAAADHGSRSFTVINPSAVVVALGTGGVGASNVAAMSLPSLAAMTLPVSAENLEIGAATPADLQAGGVADGQDVWVFVITYRHVQPFFLGTA